MHSLREARALARTLSSPVLFVVGTACVGNCVNVFCVFLCVWHSSAESPQCNQLVSSHSTISLWQNVRAENIKTLKESER